MSLSHLKILLGVTGGIAAYKAAELCRLLIRAGADVRVVMTDAAQQFVTPLTFQALSGKPVLTSPWSSYAANGMDHIDALPKGEPPRDPGKIISMTVGD